MKPINAIALAMCIISQGCSNRIERITVSVSDKKIIAEAGGRVVMEVPCETSRRGTGNGIGSKRTPLGEFKIAAKEKSHRFGPVMRLDGYQGFTRGILFHRNLDGKPNGTNGCCCPLDDDDYKRLWNWTPVGTAVRIQL